MDDSIKYTNEIEYKGTKYQKDYHFRKSPRLVSSVNQQVISLEKPPADGGKPKINWLTVLLAPVLTISIMAALVFLMDMSVFMIAMMGVTSGVSVLISFITYFSQIREFKVRKKTINERYEEYLEKIRIQLDNAHNHQMTQLFHDNPDIRECLQIVENKEETLWCRSPYDHDFLQVRIGLGEIQADSRATYQRPEVILEESELENEAIILAESSETLQKAPIFCNLNQYRITGMVGNRNDEIMLCRNMIIRLTTTHAYDELKIVLMIPERERDLWDWARWLPHCMDNDRKKRYIFTSIDDAETALDEIYDTLSNRSGKKTEMEGSIEDNIPHYLFIVAVPGILEKHPVRNQILSNQGQIGCSALIVYDKITLLPKLCSNIISVDENVGSIYATEHIANKCLFMTEDSTVWDADHFARTMAPLYFDKEGSAAAIPDAVTFLEGYAVNKPEELDIQGRWHKAQTHKSLSVPIAAMAGGNTFNFDIHQNMHGVNGIVAGMPGSGKTEMAQSWILSLAVNFSPKDVNFVLIDFKGTGLIAPFRNLPHVAGTISNLDTNIDRNLIALKNEIHRREKILDSYSDYGVKGINSLNKAYEEGQIKEHLPVLLIIIDEYAEFKKVFPDFGTEIDSLTSKGRALGMFCILMTQKPAGVVSARSEDNIRFRWCLRVANYMASKEMIGRNDAARITQSGRAFIKVGEDNLFEEVQAFWSGAPYQPNHNVNESSAKPIRKISLNGDAKAYEYFEKKKDSSASTQNEIDVVVQYIEEYCRKNHISKADQIWTEKLPERVVPTDILKDTFDGKKWPELSEKGIALGLVDDPEKQSRYPYVMNLAETGNTIIYGAPMTGKTTLLQTVAVSLALTTKPDETHVYIMDFGGWNMNILKGLPHVGGIAFDNEPERIQKLCLLLNDEMERRKEIISQSGVGNINAYRAIPDSQKLPDIVLLVDNFGAMIKLYPEIDTFFINYTNGASAYGMYLIATAGAINAVPYKISQNIKNAIALQMIDKMDYTMIVGKVRSQLEEIAGRGFIRGPLECQFSLPLSGDTEKEISGNIEKLGDDMTAVWDGDLPDTIPEMPEVIRYRLPAGGDDIMLGLSTDKVKPVLYHPDQQHYLMISGTERSGKTNLLCAVVRQMHEKMGGKVLGFNVSGDLRTPLQNISDKYFTVASDIDTFIESLRPELQKRYSLKQSGQSIEEEAIIIAIDSYQTFFKAVSNDTIDRLRAIVGIGSGLNLYLVAASDAYELSSFYNKGEALTASMIKNREVVLLGGSMNDHVMVQTKASYAQKSVNVNELEGYYISKSGTTRMKTMEWGGKE